MKFLRLLRAVLREIFDEAAYERFCAREGIRATRLSYAKFIDESAIQGKKKVRCC